MCDDAAREQNAHVSQGRRTSTEAKDVTNERQNERRMTLTKANLISRKGIEYRAKLIDARRHDITLQEHEELTPPKPSTASRSPHVASMHEVRITTRWFRSAPAAAANDSGGVTGAWSCSCSCFDFPPA